MPAEKKLPTPATDAVRALARLIHEPAEEDVPRERVQAELKSAGIDTAAVMTRVREKLGQVKSRTRLAAAREKREALLKKINRLKVMAHAETGKLRDKVRQLLDEQFGNQTEALVLFRKFEEAKDEDLQSLLDDILLIGECEDEQEHHKG